jgi:RNA polymerase sigma-70 factor, ECF subfamily
MHCAGTGRYSEVAADRFTRTGERPQANYRALMALLVALGSAPSSEVATLRRDLAHLSDEALVALVGRGDDAALGELYDRFGRSAYGLALRIVRDEALAEDAVQESFLSVWRTAARFVPERARAATWILTLVHRRSVDLVRREEHRRAEPLEAAPEPTGAATDESAWLRLEGERVRAALRQLPDQQRETIELAYFGGFTQSELADRLGQPLGTIKSRMFAGLTRLRELLSEGDSEWKPTRSTN